MNSKTDSRRRVRVAAAVLLAIMLFTVAYELASPDPAVSLMLCKFWITRREWCGVDIGTTPRTQIVTQIASMPGDAPRSALLRLLKWHLFVGPRVRDHIWRDADYTGVVTACLKGLTRWPTDRGVLAVAHSLTQDERWYPKADWYITAAAHRILLLNDMRANHVASDAEAVNYLLRQLTGSGQGHREDWAKPGFLTQKSARNVAIMNLLKEYDAVTLAPAKAALAATPAADVPRVEALTLLMGQLKMRPMLEKLNHRPQRPLDGGLRR